MSSSLTISDKYPHLVHLLVLCVDGGDEQVVGDVLEMAAELEPGSGGRDVVSCALAFHLDKICFKKNYFMSWIWEQKPIIQDLADG